MRKNSRGKLSGAVRDDILAEVQRQEEEVSSRDKSAISPDTDAAPMRMWRTDSITEEASQYHPDRARSYNFHLLTEALEVRTRILSGALLANSRRQVPVLTMAKGLISCSR